MKKIVPLLLTLTLVSAMGVSASAEELTLNNLTNELTAATTVTAKTQGSCVIKMNGKETDMKAWVKVPLQMFNALLGGKDGTIKVEGNTIVIQAVESSGTQIPNPFVDCNTLKDAGKIAGFDVTVPDAIDGYSERTIQAIKNDLIQVLYQNGENELSIRKAVGSDDVSGDYNEYAEIKTVTVSGQQVTMKGSDGKVNIATWTDGSYTYAVRVEGKGISSNSMSSLIKTIQ